MSGAKPGVAEHLENRHDTMLCLFFRLPVEVRHLIYKHIFSGMSVNIFRLRPSDEGKPQIVDIGVFLTSKKTYSESRPVFYNTVCFRFWSDWVSEQNEWPNFIRAKFGDHARVVKRVYCLFNQPDIVSTLSNLFLTLKIVELAMGQARLRTVMAQGDPDLAAEGSLPVQRFTNTIELALQHNNVSEVKKTVIEWKRLGPSRGFKVKLHWYLNDHRNSKNRSRPLRGEIDLDEWVLRILPKNNDGKVCTIPQSPWLPD